MSYIATAESIDVQAPDGKGGARIVSFSYTADGRSDAAARPVLFLFNGGPITASQWIHIGGLGPKRIAFPDDLLADPATFKLVDNGYSPLDAADLVFVDPATTGYSRLRPGTTPNIYRSVDGDAQQFAEFIALWLAKHGRQSAPVYIAGESYGTIRAPAVARLLVHRPSPVRVDGVIMIGQAANIIEYSQRPDNIISYVTALPTLAATAWYHGKANRGALSFDQFMANAKQFARTDYLVALYQGITITAPERDRIAQKLADFTGIPASYYTAHDLRISKEEFRGALLADRKLLLGRADSRYTAPLTDKGIGPDPFGIVMPAFTRLFKQYMRDDLKVDWPEEYIEMAPAPEGLDSWRWGAATPFSNWPYAQPLIDLMASNPKFKVFVGAGYYDTQTSLGAADYLVSQPGWRPDRVTMRYYQGGHVTYMVDSVAKAIGEDLRIFMTTDSSNGASHK